MTGTGAPVEMVWADGILRPISPYWLRRAEKEFTEGEVYRIVDQPERSTASHQHYFAAINEAWRNLPPLLAERFPSAEHLRRYALIKAGYSNSQSMPCGSPAAAQRFAAFVRPLDEFAVVSVEGSVVAVYTSKSQSYRHMDKKTFQASKDAVLGVLADMIEVSKSELSEAGRAA